MQQLIDQRLGQTDQLAAEAIKTIRLLIQAVRQGESNDKLHERVRMTVSAIPLTTEEFALAKNRLGNARRYTSSSEHGAACFELRCIAASLRLLTQPAL